jgi:uncharacterized protein
MTTACTADATTTVGTDYHVFEAEGMMLLFGLERAQVVRINDPRLYEVLAEFEQHGERRACAPAELVQGKPWSVAVKQDLIRQLTQLSPYTRYHYAVGKNGCTPQVGHPTEIRPSCFTLLLSGACNLRCRYCYTGLQVNDHPSELMSLEVARRAIDLLIEILNPGHSPGLLFFGGEPLLNLPVMKFCVDYLRKRSNELGVAPRYGITTNGVLLDEETGRYLKENRITVTLSMDGPAEIHDRNRIFPDGTGSHAATLRALRLLQELGIDFSVRATEARRTGDPPVSRVQLAKYFQDLGLPTVMITPVMETAENAEDFTQRDEACIRVDVADDDDVREMYRQLMSGNPPYYDTVGPAFAYFADSTLRVPGRRCGVMRSQTAVGPDGVLYPCHRFWPRKAYAIGDVFKGVDIDRYNTMVATHRRVVLSKCAACWLRNVCKGACMRFRVPLSATGGFVPPNDTGCEVFARAWEAAAGLYAKAMTENPQRVREIVLRILQPQPPAWDCERELQQ